jgi:hypothetical protein
MRTFFVYAGMPIRFVAGLICAFIICCAGIFDPSIIDPFLKDIWRFIKAEEDKDEAYPTVHSVEASK